MRVVGPTATRNLYLLSLRFRRSGTGKCECTICGYVGRFKAYGVNPRYSAVCPRCASLERHRLFRLALDRRNLLSRSERVLHFAPEPCLRRIIQEASAYYRSADFAPAPDSLLLNIEKIDLPDHSVDVVIANHVLEHVDDLAALRELRRILSDRGRMIVSIPIIEGWATTYENPSIKSKVEREIHFGQADHLRFYGRDFRDRVLSAGFSLEEFVADGPDAARYALTRGDAIFICTKV